MSLQDKVSSRMVNLAVKQAGKLMMNWAYTVLSSFRREGGGLKYLLHGVNKIHPGTTSSAQSK